jgi:hypothetical protein
MRFLGEVDRLLRVRLMLQCMYCRMGWLARDFVELELCERGHRCPIWQFTEEQRDRRPAFFLCSARSGPVRDLPIYVLYTYT